VPPEGIQRVERQQGDRVNVWPHLLLEEFIAMLILFAGLLVFSTFLNAPLREVANPNLTPNPSKAPWYFLGLQELLRYFHPIVAVILVLVGIILFALFFSLSLLRANRQAGRQAEPAEKPVQVVSRREFQRRALISSVLLFSAEFGLGTVAFLWPNLRGGFGSKIPAGSVNDIKSFIEGNKQPYYVGQGRFYVVEWNGTPGTGQANYPSLQVTAQGIM